MRLYSVNGQSFDGDRYFDLLDYAWVDKYLIPDIVKYRYMAYAARSYKVEDIRRILEWPLSIPLIRRSLHNMPGGVALGIFEAVIESSHLKEIHRPLATRMDWISAACFLARANWGGDGFRKLMAVWNRSKPGQVRKAFDIWGRRMGIRSTRKTMSVYSAFTFLADAAAAVNEKSTLVGAMEAAVRWHADIDRMNTLVGLGNMEEASKIVFPAPPFPLPEDPRFEYIGDAGRLMQEGMDMGHCVSGYWKRCYGGQTYIFAFRDEDAGRATMEISPDGRIMQSQGPHNHMTAAASLARSLMWRHLRAWKPEIKGAHYDWMIVDEADRIPMVELIG